ncbi:MAG: efflux RND transporter permease subunit [Planctomycetota bacterium]|nr:efflux RND transporter permease subunit [Planctomycetota bacterium]MDA1106292.1 efflux RND transporter permease subunit [Planctomycetota bacterium]
MSSVVRFFVRNPVAVSLLMWTLIIGGVVGALNLRREFFPTTDPDSVMISMIYPGASPAEVEDSLARKVEDAVIDIQDVDRVTTTVFEGAGNIVIKFQDGADVRKRQSDVQNSVDALQDLPADAERIRVTEMEKLMPAIQLNISGEVDPQVLKRIVRGVEDDLRDLPGMGMLVVSGLRKYEVRVHADRAALLRHGLSLTRLSDAITSWTREVSSGSLKSSDSTVAVRTLGTLETAQDISSIVVKASSDGAAIRVSDVARVEERFVDEDVKLTIDGKPGATITVFKSGTQDVVQMAELIRGYAAGLDGKPLTTSGMDALTGGYFAKGWQAGQARGPVPVGTSISTNLAKIIEDRLDLLSRNAIAGAVLVFFALLMGVSLRTAFWVMTGIATAICGTMLVMAVTGLTLNLLSMFALLLVLGMLTDDGIVVAESIDTMHAGGLPAEEAAIQGVARIQWPVIASISTTIVAFLPLGLLGGMIGDLMTQLPAVVSIALLVSLFEVFVIAPSHITHSIMRREKDGGHGNWLERLVEPFERWRDTVAWPRMTASYARAANWCVHHRYITVSGGISAFIVSLGMVLGGQLAFTFLPTDDAETLLANYSLPMGTPLDRTGAFGQRVAEAAHSQPEVRTVIGIIGQSTDFETGRADDSSSNVGQMIIELLPLEQRERNSAEVLDSIRAALGNTDEVERLSWGEISSGPSGADITYELSGPDADELSLVASELRRGLLAFEGVLDAIDSDSTGTPEVQVELRPGASAAGFTPLDVAQQLRAAIYGRDAHVFTQGGEDIDVRVSLDESARRRAGMLEEAWVVSPAGQPVPVSEIARVKETEGYASIRRKNRERVVLVTADCAAQVIPEEIEAAMDPLLARLQSEHPGVTVESGGKQKDLADAFATLPLVASTAAGLIFVILAWLFRSFWQPFAVMLAIPFGVIGVVWGHILLGFDLSFLSLIGFVALAGVVVNNSLLLVEFVNVHRAKGYSLDQALVWSGTQRFRPILLTSITTVLGLAPLVMEQSFQARFLIPMAISLCGGLISATVLTLLLLPAIVMIFDDIGHLWAWLWSGTPLKQGAAAAQ